MSQTTPAPPKTDYRKMVRLLFVLAVVTAIFYGTLKVSNIQPFNLRKLGQLEGLGAAFNRLRDFLSPELIVTNVFTQVTEIPFSVPCGVAEIPEPPLAEFRLFASPNCGSPRDDIELVVTGARPNATVQFRWLVPTGGRLSGPRVTADSLGQATATADVRPIMENADGVIGGLQAEAYSDAGGVHLSPVVIETVDKLLETLFMALMATAFGSVIAVPISFLGARNIVGRGRVGTVVYYIARFILSISRAIEPLVLALVFALLVGFGVFSGTLALTVVTIASMGKLFSEAIEDIDFGPMEAIEASGANRIQTIVYAVVPQIIPPYVSFAIYHWDINVRISTILGFVGAGGVGKLLLDFVNVSQFNKAGTPLISIIIVVAVLDYASARIRERFV